MDLKLPKNHEAPSWDPRGRTGALWICITPPAWIAPHFIIYLMFRDNTRACSRHRDTNPLAWITKQTTIAFRLRKKINAIPVQVPVLACYIRSQYLSYCDM